MPIRLMVLGEGELKETLIDEVGRLELKDKIAFLGFQDNPFKYISRARVFVLSSSYEGFGNVLIEAMALGIPVVSTRCPSGPEEIIQDGINGILVPPDDEQALAESIRTLLVREDLRSRIAKAGRERAEDFRARKIACEYEDVFREVGAVPESEGGLA